MNTPPDALQSRGPDIFIGGPPRSGTTILQRLLCQSRDTNPMVGEAEHFFYLVQAYAAALGQFDGKTKYYFSQQELLRYHREMAADYLSRFRSKFGDDIRLVLKSPWYTKYFPKLLDLVPHAQYVLILRDPLDIVTSQIEVGEKQEKRIGENYYPRTHLKKIIADINGIYLPILSRPERFGGKLIFVKYENLMTKPSALKRLSKFLDLPDLAEASGNIDAGLVDFKQDNDQDFFTQLWGEGLTASRIGRHKDKLTQKEIDIVKKMTKQIRDAFGYE
mgnify:CR=1 FL=1